MLQTAPSLSISMVKMTTSLGGALRITGSHLLVFYFAVKEAEHLDWNMRVRIIMGIAYCLQYMHHEINPPVAHSSLNSAAIFLTDDYAAKVCNLAYPSS